jgi:hypothetical protein
VLVSLKADNSKITGDLSRLVWLQFQPNLRRPKKSYQLSAISYQLSACVGFAES